MANLKVLRTRIQSVKSTRKITSAMRLVATSKVRRYQGALEAFISYESVIFKTLKEALYYKDLGTILPKYFNAPKEGKTLYIVFGADRGLCGGYVTNMEKFFLDEVEQEIENEEDFSILVCGPRFIPRLDKKFQDKIIRIYPCKDVRRIEIQLEIFCFVNALLSAGEISRVKVLYTSFHSLIKQTPKLMDLIPFGDFIGKNTADDEVIPPLFGMEADEEVLMENLCQQAFETAISHACFHSLVSEEASRMMAMENATKNASEMINKLEVLYNRTRQTAITSELLEIIAGAEALKS